MHSPPAAEADRSLSEIRAEIDAIDSALLDLLGARMGFSARLAAAKAEGPGAGGLPVRPAREVQILRRLLEAAPRGVDGELIEEVWRALISANVRRQGAIEVCAGGSGAEGLRLFDLARRHFGGVRLTRQDDPRAALAPLLERTDYAAVLPWPGGGGAGAWWPMLNESRYRGLMIIAALPMRYDGPDPEAAIVTRGVALEPAGGDETLCLAFDPHHKTQRALGEAGLTAREVGRTRDQTVLIRIEGFLGPDDPALTALARAGLDAVRVVGSIARI